MRVRINKDPAIGSSRVKKGFLLLPKMIDREWRWLEYAYWEQTRDRYNWRNSWWLDKDEYMEKSRSDT